MMKKMMMTLALASMMMLPAVAQDSAKTAAKTRLTPAERTERRANALADRMMLDDKAKAQFVPLYKQYLGEQEAIDTVAMPRAGAKVALSDEQIAQRIEMRFDKRQQKLDLDRKYYKEFKKMLTARQLQQVFSPTPQDGKQQFRFLQKPGQLGTQANWKQGNVKRAPRAKQAQR